MSSSTATDKSLRHSGVEKRRGITATQAMSYLEKNGIVVSEEEAEKILDFLYIIGKNAVRQYFKETDVSK